MNRVEEIKRRLVEQLQASSVQVLDEGHKHIGHPGARDGRGHFAVRVVSHAFADKSTLQRHRMVYDAMGTLMQTDIHALSVEAMTEEEA